MSTRNSTAATSGTLPTDRSEAGRRSYRSAQALSKPEYKGDVVNPSYALDAAAEGISVTVDRSDNDLNVVELGRKYSADFGTAELVIINISGTIFEDLQTPLKQYPGSLLAYKMIKEQDVAVVLMTNSWKKSKSSIVELLMSNSFEVDVNDIFTSSDACKQYLREKNLTRPYYLVHGDVYKDFEEEYPRCPNENVVIVGLPSTQFDYRLLSKGMSLLEGGAPYLVLNTSKGRITPTSRNIALGPGPFITMLAACTDAEPVALCKPNAYFFEAICKKVGCSDYSKAIVVGDEINEDIAGAKALGLKAILTRTGGYQLNDEKTLCANWAPDATAENFAMAIRLLLACLAVSQMSEADFLEAENSTKGCGSMGSDSTENSGDSLTKKVEGYLTTEFKPKHSVTESNKNPLHIPDYIW